jgi:hypothetical protein
MSSKTAISTALAAIAHVIVNTAASMGAAAGNPGALRNAAKADRHSRQERRRGAGGGSRDVERAVIDQWLLWRK